MRHLINPPSLLGGFFLSIPIALFLIILLNPPSLSAQTSISRLSLEPSFSYGYLLETLGDIHPFLRVGLDLGYRIRDPFEIKGGVAFSQYNFIYQGIFVKNISGGVENRLIGVDEDRLDLSLAGLYRLISRERLGVSIIGGYKQILLENDFKDLKITGPLLGLRIDRPIGETISVRLEGSGIYDIQKSPGNKIVIKKTSGILYDPGFEISYLALLRFKTRLGEVGLGYEGETINFTFINRFSHALTLRLLF